MPANWLKIKPIKLGDKNSYLIITALTQISSDSNYLGLSSTNDSIINLKPKFNYPSFNKSVDFVLTHLTTQVFSEGMTLDMFYKRIDNFIKSNAPALQKHREFVKIQ